ncbi:MAG: hypothetical protein HY922_00290 [Elusimicrobia bacterium]|nr:hypothetical protein [Elusimicrobiota bacterium]
MKTRRFAGLAALAALLVSTAAFAEEKGKPADEQKQEQAGGPQKHGKKMCPDCKVFRMQMKADNEAFHKQMKADKEAFHATLKDKKAEEKKAAKAEFRKRQDAEKEEFRKQQDGKREEFKKNHKCACGAKGPKAEQKPEGPTK